MKKEINQQPVIEKEIDDTFLPKKDLFRIDEAAKYFDCEERTVRLWIQHGKLEAETVPGGTRIPRNSILRCRIKKYSVNL